MIILFFSLLTQLSAHAQNTELGLGSQAQSQLYFSPTSFSQNITADISQAVSDSKSYQVGVRTDYALANSAGTFRALATATIHFTNTEWKNAFYLKPMLGWGTTSVVGVTSSGIVYGMQVGKRFMITDQLMYRPTVDFVRDSTNTAQVQVTLIGLSLFISAPQFF